PLAGRGRVALASLGLPIAEMKPFLDRAIVRLPARLEAASCGTGIQDGVTDGAGHISLPPICHVQEAENRRCPTRVQYTWKNAHRQAWPTMHVLPMFPVDC